MKLFLTTLLISCSAWADVTWTNTTANFYPPGDYTSSGIVTIGANITLASGTYTFASLVVNSTRTLTLAGNTATNTGVTINATNITITGTMKADAQGFTGGSGTGKGANATYAGGGAYGGFGGSGDTNATAGGVSYGSVTVPLDLGSGGGSGISGSGATGGGAINLSVSSTLTVTGTLSANGGNATSSYDGGGSGGSILISTAVLAGAGPINAKGGNGGSNGSGAGGGGRIYISYSSSSSYTGTIAVTGGTASSGGSAGGVGSALLVNSATNDLVIPTSSSLTSGTFSYNNVTINSGATLSVDGAGFSGQAGPGAGTNGTYGSGGGHGGTGGYADTTVSGGDSYGNAVNPTTAGSGGGRGINGTVGASGGGVISLQASGTFTITGSISANGASAKDNYEGGGAGGSISISGATITGAGAISANGGTGGSNRGGGGAGGRVYISYTTTNNYTGTVTATGQAGGGNVAGQTGSILIVNSTNNDLYINFTSSLSSGTYNFRNITIATGVILKSDGLGSRGGEGTSPGTTVSNYGTGGNYGGLGGGGVGSIYGSAVHPIDPGSGGGPGINGGGADGGGIIILNATGTLTVNGTISSNGTAALTNYDGGGSGGGIAIVAGTISGAGSITANGGNGGTSGGGGGGGGRISITYATNSYTGTITVTGGLRGSPSSVAGSIIFLNSATGEVICNTASTFTASASDFSGGPITVQNACKMTIDGGISATTVTVTGSGSILKILGNLLATSDINLTTSGALVIGGNTVTGNGYTISAANVTIGTGASLNADGQGFGAGLGQGAGSASNYGTGGGYGGTGNGTTTSSTVGATYGSSINPVLLGSGGGTGSSNTGASGGGAIALIVPGTLTVTGTLSANGSAASSTAGGGSGGSLWITAGTLAGAGTIKAAGGNGAGNGGGGGGGRIFISYTTNTFTVANATAARGTGGTTPASTAGTVVWQGVGTATQLSFVMLPTTAVRKLATFPQQPLVAALDASNDIVATFSGAVALAAFTDSGCTVAASGTLNSSSSTVNGLAWFSGVSYSQTGYIYLKATSGGLSSPCIAVTVGGAMATQLVFTTQPSATSTAGVLFAQQPVVTAEDADGNADIISNISTIVVYDDASCSTATSGGTFTSSGSLSSGVTTFSGVKFTKAGTFYLGAAQTLSGVSLKGCSSAFIITPGVLSNLVFSQQPSSSAAAGDILAQQPQISGTDTYGNLISSFSLDVTLAPFSNGGCTTSGTGAFTGAGPFTPVAGVASASGVSYTKSGYLYLKATASGLTAACSSGVLISAGPPASLVINTQPSSTGVTNVNLKTQPVVGALDVYGNVATLAANVTMSPYKDSGCSTTPASGTITNGGAYSGGVFTFKNLRYSKAEVIYMQAVSGSLTTACSTAVSLIPNVPMFFRQF